MAGPAAEKVSSVMQAAAAGVVILVAIGGCITYLNGGWRLQTQVSVDTLSGKLSDLTTSVDSLKTKLDQMPRVSDFASHTTQIDVLGKRIDETVARLTRDEIESAGSRQAIDGLLHPNLPPVRTTR